MTQKCLRVIAILVGLFLLFGCNRQSTPPFSTDAERFKYEYESLNGKRDDYGNKMREVNIPSDNPIVYASFTNIIDQMEAGKTFVVYFGFSKCPWCRGYLEAMLASADKCDIDTIYYVDIYKSRDEYKLKNGDLEKVSDGATDYERLLKYFDNVLADYILTDEDGNEISVGEKRIYAPNVIVVREGKAVGLAQDSTLFTDAYGEISQTIFADMQNNFLDVFHLIS